MIEEINGREKIFLTEFQIIYVDTLKAYPTPSFEHRLDLVTCKEQSMESGGNLIVEKPSKHCLGQMTPG